MKRFKRRRKRKTDYRQRLALLKAGSTRLVVRRALSHIHIQAIEYQKGDTTVMEVSSKELRKYGWKGHLGNLASAYLTGFLTGLRCLKKGIKNAVLDAGLQSSVKGNAIYAAALGARDAGLKLPLSKSVLEEKRAKGLHIAEYAKKIKQDKEKYEKQFAAYLKNGLEPEKLPEHFEDVKKKISEGFDNE